MSGRVHLLARPGFAAPAGVFPISLAMLLSDVLAVLAAFLASTGITEQIQTRLLERAPAEFYSPFLANRMAIVAFLTCLLIGWFARKRHYSGRRGFWTEAKDVLIGVIIIALLDGWLHFALKMQASRLWQVQLWVYAAGAILCTRCLVRQGLARLGLWLRPTLLIGATTSLEELRAFASCERALGYDVRATVDLGDAGHDIRARLDGRLAAHPELSHALIACSDVPLGCLGDLIESLDQRRIRYGLIPPLRGMPLVGLKVDQFIGYDFILLQSHRPLFDHTRAAKRCFDVVAACVLLVGFAPLLLAIAALLRLDGGPALYASRRLGHRGTTFHVLKFRTMRPDAERVLHDLLARDPARLAEWQAHYKLKDDPRVTWLGRFLRRSSLDELPQLINVLRGEMSLVGPRPLLPDEASHHERSLHLYQKVLPGITGMWQVSGRNDLDYAQRIRLNNWYVHNWSLWHDLVILIKTVGAVVRGAGAR